jgi:NodT family efflux transporter outer membrane factor (OMF) lipoprotein
MGAIKTIVISALLLSASACALRESRDPDIPLPASLGEAPVATAAWPSREWYLAFGSNELSELIKAAEQNGLDVQMAQARVAQADARVRAARAGLLPSVDAAGNINYLAGHSGQGSGHETDWSALLSASYEIDFFGKNHAAARAARSLAQVSRAERDTIALTTLAGVASSYFQVLSLRERTAIAEANLKTAQDLLAVVQARFDAGMATPVELAMQKAVLASAALVLPDLRQQQSEAKAALAVLLGRAPEGFDVKERTLEGINEPAVSAGLPSELLTRRPDLAGAEANMQAAHADLTVARAALLPSVTLTASGGVANPALNAAVLSLSGTGPTLNLGAGLLQPIFDGGRLRALRDEAQAKDRELIIAYRAAILAALVDVENALSGLQHLNEAAPFQAQNETESAKAFDGATARFKEGSGDYLTVLEAQRALYAARDQRSQYRLSRLQATVTLCKALGGGWQVQSKESQ